MCIAFVIGLLYSLIKKNSNQEPIKYLGVYTEPGKWYYLKYWLFVVILVIRRLKYYIFGKSYFHEESQIEKLQPLSSHRLACDAVFFQGVSQDGIYISAGAERRHEGKVNGLFYIVLPEYGVLTSEKLPKTTLNADPDSLLNHKYFGAEGIRFTPVVPMKLWKVSYKGRMRIANAQDKFVNVDLQAEWKSNLPWFLFEVDMPVTILARSIAREPWSREYFKSLKEAHQTHYEQMGYLNGTLKIDDKIIKIDEMDSFRDHSYWSFISHVIRAANKCPHHVTVGLCKYDGIFLPKYDSILCHKRDWSLMHRYIYHVFYLSDRTKISVGVVCQPCTSTHLEMGYVTHPDGKLDPIESCDLLLYQHAETGILDKELRFTFTANGIDYHVKVRYDYDDIHYKGNDTEARMHERFLTCEINGISGKGIAEWHYNNINK